MLSFFFSFLFRCERVFTGFRRPRKMSTRLCQRTWLILLCMQTRLLSFQRGKYQMSRYKFFFTSLANLGLVLMKIRNPAINKLKRDSCKEKKSREFFPNFCKRLSVLKIKEIDEKNFKNYKFTFDINAINLSPRFNLTF